jgi:hypothetical protein
MSLPLGGPGHRVAHPVVLDAAPSRLPAGLPDDWGRSITELAQDRSPEVFIRTGWFRVPIAQTAFLYGDGGIGKSSYVYQFGLAVATGLEFMGGSTEARRVLFLDAEASAPEVAFRLQAAAKHFGVPLDQVDEMIKVVSLKHLGTTAFDLGESIQGMVESFDPALIIIDSYNSAFGGDPTISEHVNNVNRFLNRLAAKHRAVLVLHHISTTEASKSTPNMGGLRTIRNNARLVYRMGKETSGGLHKLAVEKVNPKWDGPTSVDIRRVPTDEALLFDRPFLVDVGDDEDAPQKTWRMDDVANGDAVLHVLRQAGEIRLTALQQVLVKLIGRSASSIREALRKHNTLDELEAIGQIIRRPDASDKRATLVDLAPTR